MAFNEELAFRIRQNIQTLGPDFTEKKMFGGLAFLYKGKMTVGIVNDDLMVRVVDSKFKEILERPHVREMDFTGRSMKEFIYVEPPAYGDETQLTEWINLGIEHAKGKLG